MGFIVAIIIEKHKEDSTIKTAAKEVYHSSNIQGLKQICAQGAGTHGQHWVYAAYNQVMSALFLAKPLTSEFICAKRIKDGKVTLTERFKGAFDLSYAGKQGAIYVLPRTAFIEGETDFSEELVTTDAVTPIREIQIDDVKQYMLTQEKQGKLEIYYYPNKAPGIPEDDEDLIIDATVWHQTYGDAAIEKLGQYHPHLKQRAIQAIKNQTYAEVKTIGLMSALNS